MTDLDRSGARVGAGTARAVLATPVGALCALAGLYAVGIAGTLHLLDAPMRALPAAWLCFAAGTGIASGGLVRRYPHRSLGACNAVTLLRLALAATLATAVLAPEWAAARSGALFALAAAALALDGLDGWLARRAELCSAFGARFDMETDAVLGAVLALIAIRLGVGGPLALPALLVLGFARYAFVLAAAIRPRLRAALPARWSRKVVCVIQIGTLAALLPPLAAGLPAAGLALAAAGLLLWSFGRDVLWLLRRPG
ncbi:CDP-alcohol phosphatidyltransferase family protein [uncultured Jannaschia sp.]|uniref:CDP-alcohol phosphatidyltransferase family protein n=1 Tax=uncultured Jannaschia sp. TaxID=293347 RepID=UPI002618659B|nr:CDP-alcohol phosphatidyltransferase family protein [uncultured Jannaschia sp.]